jgi:hypothetical protein
MALGQSRSRQDSFGLEARPDGTLAFDFPREESGAGVANSPSSGSVARGVIHGAEIDRQRRSSRPQLYKNELRVSIGPLMRRRRRRDSFGLEVRQDGTLSFDQLASGGSLDLSRVASGSGGDDGVQGSGNGTRRDSGIWDSLVGSGSHHIGADGNASQSGRLRRRDSFGLEVRADGTLSLDGLVNPAQESERLNHRSHPQDQPSSPPSASHSQANGNGSNHIAASETIRASGIIAGPHSSVPRADGSRTRDGMGTTLGHREVQLLMERVRRLEAELVRRGRPPTRDAMDVPPAYESRSGSPTRAQRQQNGLSRGEE